MLAFLVPAQATSANTSTLHSDSLRHRASLLRRCADFCCAPLDDCRPGASCSLASCFRHHDVRTSQMRVGGCCLRLPQVDALDLFDSLLDNPRLHFRMRLEPGDLQFCYNHTLLHDRCAFEDWPEVDRRRQLFRLWLSPPADRPLPASFAARFGTVEVSVLCAPCALCVVCVV
jgi:hypothetical protein